MMYEALSGQGGWYVFEGDGSYVDGPMSEEAARFQAAALNGVSHA